MIKVEHEPFCGIISHEIEGEKERLQMWEDYQESFQAINEKVAYYQSLFKADFLKVLTDPDFTKVVVYHRQTEFAGLGVYCNKLNRIGRWLSEPCIRKNFPEEIDAGLVYYIVTTFLKKQFRHQALAKAFLCFAEAGVEFMRQQSGGKQIVFVCDYPPSIDKFWPEKLKKFFGHLYEGEQISLGTQEYFAQRWDTARGAVNPALQAEIDSKFKRV